MFLTIECQKNNFEILYLYLDCQILKKSIFEYGNQYKDYWEKAFFEKADIFNITKEDIELFSRRFHKLFYSKLMRKIGYTDYLFDENISINEFHIFYLNMIISNKNFKIELIDFLKLL